MTRYQTHWLVSADFASNIPKRIEQKTFIKCIHPAPKSCFHMSANHVRHDRRWASNRHIKSKTVKHQNPMPTCTAIPKAPKRWHSPPSHTASTEALVESVADAMAVKTVLLMIIGV